MSRYWMAGEFATTGHAVAASDMRIDVEQIPDDPDNASKVQYRTLQ